MDDGGDDDDDVDVVDVDVVVVVVVVVAAAAATTEVARPPGLVVLMTDASMPSGPPCYLAVVAAVAAALGVAQPFAIATEDHRARRCRPVELSQDAAGSRVAADRREVDRAGYERATMPIRMTVEATIEVLACHW